MSDLDLFALTCAGDTPGEPFPCPTTGDLAEIDALLRAMRSHFLYRVVFQLDAPYR